MASESQTKWIPYSLILFSFLFIFFALDQFFGLHYQPDEHRLNKDLQAIKAEHEAAMPHKESSHHENEVPLGEVKDPVVIKENDPLEEDKVTTDTDGYFQNLRKKYLQKVSNIPENKTRTDVIIRYYHHEPDGKAAYALENLKFYIHERPVNQAYQDYQSNSIYYGNNVSNEDIRLVAYTLLNEGLPIKTIKPTSYEWKSNSIEIGTDASLDDLKTLTLEEVQNFSR